MSKNIFKVIRDQLAFNNARKTEQKLKLMGDYGYPARVLNWLFRQGVLKIDGKNVTKSVEVTNGKRHTYYVIPYYDFDQSNSFCDIACDIAENDLIKKDKAGYFTDGPVTTKMGQLNDKYRYELECPNGCEDYEYESGTVFYPEDNAFADWVVKDRGWKDMQEFIDTFQDNDKDELAKYLREFYQEQIAPDYATGEEEEELEGV